MEADDRFDFGPLKKDDEILHVQLKSNIKLLPYQYEVAQWLWMMSYF